MKFVNSNVTLLSQEEGIEGMLKQIERAGRVSYKSEDKINDDSYNKFIDMLKERGHFSPFEHGTVYLEIPFNSNEFDLIKLFDSNPYSVTTLGEDRYWITTNYRVIVENNVENCLTKYMVNVPTENHEKRVSIDIICSRGISHELVRHRQFSFTQESTRYCNYSKDKHDNCVKFIIPTWANTIHEGDEFDQADLDIEKVVTLSLNKTHSAKTLILIALCVGAEKGYMNMLDAGEATPQEAREVLPNALKTEVVMTGTISQWVHFLKLRSPQCGAKGVHPDMEVIGNHIYELLKTLNYVNKNLFNNDKED